MVKCTVSKKYDTDKVMQKLWLCLLSDFRNVIGLNYADSISPKVVGGDIRGFRGYNWPSRDIVDPFLFRADYQLESLFKRYRFKKDVYSDDQLRAMTIKKFLDTQTRIAVPLTVTPVVSRVLQGARHIITKILGVYDKAEHLSLCRFGKRACVGTSYQDSYLDTKLLSHLTGSEDHLSWFATEYLPSDPMLGDLLSRTYKMPKDGICEEVRTRSGPPLFRGYYEFHQLQDAIMKHGRCDTLKISLVPKSYKSFRTIMPDTLIGSFYTNGIGRVLQRRLMAAGLDIRHLQMKHRTLASRASLKLDLVTADLSAASDSLTKELMRRLLPKAWYDRIFFGRINKVLIDDECYQIQSVATMGLGHTFPLQTLIFYALLKSIAGLANVSGKISVYGDDLIYPRKLHRFVVGIFPKLHLLLNDEKTYCTTHFRESCGGDYYRGFDVRPFQPQGEHQLHDRFAYASFLHKLYNGLKLRWWLEEIPQTLEYLKSELILAIGILYQVPPSFPDESGLKVETPSDEYFACCLSRTKSTNAWEFKFLRKCSDLRLVETQFSYYWERMRQLSLKDDDAEEHPWDAKEDRPVLIWKKIPYKRKYMGRGHRHKRMLESAPHVASKSRSRLLIQTGSVTNWI